MERSARTAAWAWCVGDEKKMRRGRRKGRRAVNEANVSQAHSPLNGRQLTSGRTAAEAVNVVGISRSHGVNVKGYLAPGAKSEVEDLFGTSLAACCGRSGRADGRYARS